MGDATFDIRGKLPPKMGKIGDTVKKDGRAYLFLIGKEEGENASLFLKIVPMVCLLKLLSLQ